MEPTLQQTQGPRPASDGSSPVHQILCRLRKERSPAEMVAVLKTLERPRRSKAVQSEIKSLIQTLEGHLATDGTREAVAVALTWPDAQQKAAVSIQSVRATNRCFRDPLQPLQR
ncbi:hypothetical protein ASE79_06215 [Sphingomonas sp. Leaf28]|nr:hypothetical protein ASE79_06215 [Sphingomonas sp. Leaf28]